MKTEINSPMGSKINWTAGLGAVGNIAIFMWVPEEHQTQAMVALNAVAVPGLIMVFRTWFTKP